MKLCKEEGCPNPAWEKGKCRDHLKVKKKRRSQRSCTFPGYDNEHLARGYCSGCYRRMVRHGVIVAQKGIKKLEVSSES